MEGQVLGSGGRRPITLAGEVGMRQLGFDFDICTPAIQESGREGKARALERVAKNAPPGWMEDAIVAIRHLALTKKHITSDDIWPLVSKPPEPRAMGAAFTNAAKRGILRKTRMVQNSKRPACHSRPIAVWEVCE